jgi:two-component system OmpR family sensor kinase
MKRNRSFDEQTLRRSARRIVLQTVAGVALTVLVLTGIGVAMVLNDQHRAEDETVSAAIARADDVNDPPTGMWLVIQRDGSQAISPGLASGLPDQDALRQTAADGVGRTADVRVGGLEYRVVTQRYGSNGVIQAVVDLSADHVQRQRLTEAFLLTGAVGLVLAGVIGVWLARRAIAPMATALALQRRFVADAGHELRTPLTLLSTRAQLIERSLRHDTDPVVLRSDVDGLLRDARQLADILDDLLLVADRSDSTVAEPVDLGQLVREAVDSARPAAEARQVSLKLDQSKVTVRGSTAGLRRAVNALLDNAIRHAGGEVQLAVSRRGRQGLVDVTDDGPGIDPGILPTLFARFATTPADGARGGSRRYGLGLSLVSEIASQHGGSISVVDTGDGGATFRLLLPAVELQESSQKLPAS